MRKRMVKTLVSFVLAFSVWIGSLPAAVQAHGTTTQVVTKEMLVTSPDKDYKVNMDMQRDAKDGAYNEYFLKDSLQTVSIDIDENNLNYLLQNAEDKPSVMTNSVTIGDQKIGYAGLKTKGNYTLSHAYEEENNDRFSFTINFGKYIKKKEYGVKQNFYGCSKISFNNFYFDKSMMKEYFAMKLMSEMGVPTSQYGLAKLYINGQYYGVYFMVEPIESTIVEQYQKAVPEDVSSYLAKPEKTKLQYDSAFDSLMKEDGTFDLSSVLVQNEKEEYRAEGILKEQEGLWEGDSDMLQDVADMLPTVLSWEKKLNQLNEGKDFSGQNIDVNSEEYIKLLDTIMDVDEALRYFATHSFLVQLDDMFENEQNFGLYIDKNGKSLLLPWDYDLCFGCYYPGRAELTANFDLELMYWDWDAIGTGQLDYSQYPIFNVLYQNAELMERYRSYMKECSQIVLLGGTLSNGKSYQPAYFTSYIDKMQEELTRAASEKLASNAYYHQGVSQPSAMLLALPNLSKIMAMRSVGVYNQVEILAKESEYYYVTANGCDLSTLGNGVASLGINWGSLELVDDKTGISVGADYGEEDVNREEPRMTFTRLGKTDVNYQAVKEVTGCQNEDNLTVYKIDCNVTPVTKYMVTIPLDRAYSTDEIAVYSYTKDKTTKLNLKMNQNLCFGKTGSIQYIAVLKTAGETALKEVGAEDDSVNTLPAEKDKETEKKKVIALNKKAVTLKKGKTCQLKLKNAEKKVTWKSTNKKVATVSRKGRVTAKKKGTVWIKAVSGKKTYRCKVKVR